MFSDPSVAFAYRLMTKTPYVRVEDVKAHERLEREKHDREMFHDIFRRKR